MDIKAQIMNSGLRRVHFTFIEVTSCKHCKHKRTFIQESLRMPLFESTVDYGLSKSIIHNISLKLSDSIAKVEVIVSNKFILCKACENKMKKALGGM